jgi:hypothetical protein
MRKNVKLGVIPEDPFSVVPNLLSFLYRHGCLPRSVGMQPLANSRIRQAQRTVNEINEWQ